MCSALLDWTRRPDEVTYLVVGLEKCESTGRIHLQCYVELAAPQRLSWVRGNPLPNRWHWEPRRWGSVAQASDYCKKEGRFREFGTRSDQARKARADDDRKIWADVAEKIRSHTSWLAVLRDASLQNFLRRSLNWAQAVWDSRHFPSYDLDLNAPGFKWQGKLARFLQETTADDRTIIWVLDAIGNRGKSQMVKWLMLNAGACVLPNDARSTAAVWDGQGICVSDVPRDVHFDNYGAVEALKNGLIINTKYVVSTRFSNKPPHVVVFSNHQPLPGKFSTDRLLLIDLDAVTDDTRLDEIFSPSRFPEVDRLLRASAASATRGLSLAIPASGTSESPSTQPSGGSSPSPSTGLPPDQLRSELQQANEAARESKRKKGVRPQFPRGLSTSSLSEVVRCNVY